MQILRLGRSGLAQDDGAFGRGRCVKAEAEEVHIRRGINDAQGAVDIEGVDAGDAVEALREHALENVARRNVLLGAAHGFKEGGTGGTRSEGEPG